MLDFKAGLADDQVVTTVENRALALVKVEVKYHSGLCLKYLVFIYVTYRSPSADSEHEHYPTSAQETK